MKNIYIDIMERALSAYSNERIEEYVSSVKASGLTEHGFPRLAANIGLLISFGRRTELLPVLTEMMNICCEQMPRVSAANDFSVREICLSLELVEKKGVVDKTLTDRWRAQLSEIDPWKCYDVVPKTENDEVNNWAAYGALSELVRGRYLGIDTSEFVEWQLPSQMRRFDENGMYKDPANPMVYDLVRRSLLAALLYFGYEGKFAKSIEKELISSAELTLQAQSVSGEIPFGGRSNQFHHNEMMLASINEFYAGFFAARGDMKRAAEHKAAAEAAVECAFRWLSEPDCRHIKNYYDKDSLIGCESYGYFNKYMITVASFAYMAYIFADDDIAPSVAPSEKGGYITVLSEDFHKIFINCSGYFLELDTNADPHYDSNGLGRVHKRGCSPVVCLSTPFTRQPQYKLEGENSAAASICCYAFKDNILLSGAESYAKYHILKSYAENSRAELRLLCELGNGVSLNQSIELTEEGVRLILSGYEASGFMLPVFEFDGQRLTDINESDGIITVGYGKSVCEYRFLCDVPKHYTLCYNRNGRYRLYYLESKELLIKIKGRNENE